MSTLHCRRCTGVTLLCLPGLCSLRSFSSSDDSSQPGSTEAGMRSVDARGPPVDREAGPINCWANVVERDEDAHTTRRC